MTAYAMKGDRDKCLRAGMDAYIAKPLRAPELRWLVECLTFTEEADLSDRTRASESSAGYRFSQALQRLEGDAGIFEEQIEFFLHDSPALMEEVHSAIGARDPERLQAAAHRLKGLAAAFDDAATQETLGQLEEMGRLGDLERADDAWHRLQADLFRLQQALWYFLRDRRTPGPTG
jgi:HPt (histidine-containing phosphotransfer) domain-containing protein